MKVRIVTGMLKMKYCELTVGNNELVVTEPGEKRAIPLSSIESIQMTRHVGKATHFEIQLANETVEGIFADKCDANMFANNLKDLDGTAFQISFRR